MDDRQQTHIELNKEVAKCPSCETPLTSQEIALDFFLCSACVNRDSDDYQSNHSFYHKELDDIVFS
ncbi:hypothetical protein VP249E411_P0266 [Vibrio phage 249E41-1]|nr:hypothetical protein VP249E411_P0266 [Vibrio phage 249E41-1]CAH9014870.1 hypothetical protein VP277E431_P0257 [Vibrio phage 277E43-1]CAH9014886.1 hypothetical protein VP495E541_P0265 [Vibrio phage 495E54-1]CAH9014900.1 hypothetical protein VP496E541_P0257 [Vibrio phage 496E54-1]CAH9017570.1 hypothetical protein VP193E371_P0265 [Vibrio phage 193E37-1]